MPKVFFASENQSFFVKKGTEFRRLSELFPNAPLKFGCLQGHCGTCRIKITSGTQNISPETKQEIETIEKLCLKNTRLACQCAINGDIDIEHSYDDLKG